MAKQLSPATTMSNRVSLGVRIICGTMSFACLSSKYMAKRGMGFRQLYAPYSQLSCTSEQVSAYFCDMCNFFAFGTCWAAFD